MGNFGELVGENGSGGGNEYSGGIVGGGLTILVLEM